MAKASLGIFDATCMSEISSGWVMIRDIDEISLVVIRDAPDNLWIFDEIVNFITKPRRWNRE